MRDPRAPPRPRRRAAPARRPLRPRAGKRLYLVGGSVRDAILGRALDRHRPRLHHRRPARGDRGASSAGWADAVWTQGKRFGTIGCAKDGRRVRDHDPPGRGLPPRLAQARRRVRRRRRGRSGPPRLHRQRHGAAPCPRLRADRPLRRRRRPGCRGACARPLVTGGVLQRRPAPHAAGGPLHRRLRAGARPRARRRPSRSCGAGWRSCRPSGSATSSTSCSSSTARARACGSSSTPAWPSEFLPELPGLALEQDPIHRHKDVLAHTIAVVERTPPPTRILRLAALLHDIGKPKTRSFGPNGVSFHHHEVVGARMAEERMRALRYPNDEIDGGQAPGRAAPAVPRLRRRGWTDSRRAPLRPRRRARCSSASTS